MESSPPKPLQLTDFIDAGTLQTLQDRCAALSEVATSFLRPDGQAITRPAMESEFCQVMKSSPSGAAACRESHCRAAAGVTSRDIACEMQCHAGLAQFAAPIVVRGQHLATLLMGERPRVPLTDDAVAALAAAHGMNADELRRAAWALRPWSDRDIRAAVDFLQFLATALARRCYQESQLQDRVMELSGLFRLNSMLAEATDLQTILDRSAQLIVDVLAVKASSLRLLDEETGELSIAAVHNLSPEYLNKGRISVKNSPIDEEALQTGMVYIANQPADPRTVYPAEARREGIVSALVVAMKYRAATVGVMRIYTDRPREFTPSEQSLVRTMASQMAAAIIHARLRRDAADAERLERQVAMAGAVQRRMIPAAAPKHAHLEIGAVYRPSLALSGDFFDFLELPRGNLGVSIADVAGKGIPASLTMASVRATLRAHAKSIYDIDRIMAEVNRQICHDTQISEFVTAWYGVFAPDGRRITYCNAGHEPPLLLRGERIERLDVGGFVLGIEQDAHYDKGIVHLQPGDILLLSTDGLVEGMNFDGEAFGRERLREAMLQHRGLPAQSMASQVLWDLRRFRGLAEQSDDISIVLIKVN